MHASNEGEETLGAGWVANARDEPAQVAWQEAADNGSQTAQQEAINNSRPPPGPWKKVLWTLSLLRL